MIRAIKVAYIAECGENELAKRLRIRIRIRNLTDQDNQRRNQVGSITVELIEAGRGRHLPDGPMQVVPPGSTDRSPDGLPDEGSALDQLDQETEWLLTMPTRLRGRSE